MKDYGTVSIVMPVYGVEKYISKCLDSICSQTYQNLEIIVIDDESKDCSGKIADHYAQQDNRIHVEHIVNRGAAGARNVALNLCTGNYIMFVDSDDWLEDNMVECLLTRLHDTNSDIVQCQYYDEYIGESREHKIIEREMILSDEEFIKDMIPHWENILIWNKIYKKEVLDGIRFVEGRCIDDEFYTYQVIMNAKQILIIPDNLYHYRIRRSSAMGNSAKQKQRLRDQIDFITWRYPVLAHRYPALQSMLLCHMAEVLMSVMQRGADYKDIFEEAEGYLKKYFLKILFDKKIPLNLKKSTITYIIRDRKHFLETCKMEVSQEKFYE